MKLESLKNLQFLSPTLTIKLNHLTKDDISNVKDKINNNLGSASFFISLVLAVVSVIVFLYLQISSGWRQIEIYGVSSFAGDIGCFSLCVASMIFKLISLKVKSKKVVSLLNRFTIDSLYVAITVLMFSSFYADAEKGFLSKSPTLCVAIVLIALLLVIQPIYNVDALVLNIATLVIMVTFSIILKYQFEIQSFVYYILISIVFILMSRFIISIIFYAEVQKYIQESISNSLLDTVMYDELTHCKNRYALKKYLETKVPLWREDETKLLVVMFDIDNFKEYNDYFSHQVGDGCLKGIAAAIKKTFPFPGLEFYRYGGEEFLLIFELNEKENPKEILEKIRLSASELDIKAPPTSKLGYLTVSVGGHMVTADDHIDFASALNEADANLYKAKADGKNICYLNKKAIRK